MTCPCSYRLTAHKMYFIEQYMSAIIIVKGSSLNGMLCQYPYNWIFKYNIIISAPFTTIIIVILWVQARANLVM